MSELLEEIPGQELAIHEPESPVAQRPQVQPLSVDRICERVALVQEAMKRAMQEGVHYGKIPGCGPKPTLLKPGAEMLGTLFQFGHRYKVRQETVGPMAGHLAFFVTCEIFYQPTGHLVDTGEGVCSTRESKYLKQVGPKKDKYGKEYYLGPEEFYNTCLKMAAKRALVAATINATGCSSLFTQDVEENPELYQNEEEPQEERKSWDTGAKKRPYTMKPSTAATDRGTVAVDGKVEGNFTVEGSWSTEWEGKEYFFVKTQSGLRFQTSDPELGAKACGFGKGSVAHLVGTPSGKGRDKLYLESIEPEALP
jgi:hypothetical protein